MTGSSGIARGDDRGDGNDFKLEKRNNKNRKLKNIWLIINEWINRGGKRLRDANKQRGRGLGSNGVTRI